MSPFRSRQEYTNRSNFSPVQIEIKLQESDDECDLVIDVPPQPVNKKPEIRRNRTKGNRDRELAAVIREEKLCVSTIADIFECTEEKSEKMFTLWKNSKGLNKREIPGNVFPKANEIYLPEVDTDTLKVLEEGDALAYTDEKHTSSAASVEADMQKGILKQQNAETYMLVEAFVQEHTINEDCVSSGRVTRSILSTGHLSKDESTTGRPYKEIINIEESQSIEAMKEEQSVYDRCGSKKMYLNLAVKTLKKLRDHGQLCNSRSSSGAGSMKSEDEKAFTGNALYELLTNYLLTEEQLKENNFPRPNPEKNGHAILSGVLRNTVYDAFKRLCCRCGEVYAVTASGEHRRKEECSYHSGRVLEQKVPGGMEKRYSCCDRAVGSDGCQIAKLHVHDGKKKKLEGFMKTLIKSPPVDGNYGVYALDCETCYTTHGLELIRVAVVNAKLQVVYDTFVKPDGKIVDYDKRLSGVTENDLKNTTTSLRGVQAILLNLFSADTILIGHSLEDGLFALKLIHDRVVDTSVVFPHWQGLPHKRQLTSLVADYLRKIRQDDVCGHNSREDAIACMELMLWKVKEDNKKRKW
ncbi:PREDICTED: RNA exonuclease 1 homolog [Haliaeetus leucocephalus]|uniref:RNA exonuclease 1 homolog n=1 Tax=Haliaeetus leucocephalus TaxID=52644 RepID=UPI00053CBF2B|nr:PREDICTED: RNA exonuclease 1 homolog [Haliaeetus leucocephalus]